MPEVLNKYHVGFPPGSVSIMRPGPFGNPFPLEDFNGDRVRCIEAYNQWIITQPHLIARIKRELKGLDLVCCCVPRLCHGHTILKIANSDYLNGLIYESGGRVFSVQHL